MGFPRPYGRYVLEDRLAMGGMAEIFRARTATTGFEKRVCIKRVLPHFLSDDDFVTMFRDEAKTAARLQHANVVQVFDFGEVDDDEGRPTLFLAMELIEGLDLRKLADMSRKRGIPFGVGEVTQIGIDICRGLHHAHNLRDENGELLGVVHRDISPHNILVSTQGEVKITDFGIAKAAERATHTSTGIVKGKVAYMSPEQAEGKDFDHRLDQWATGVVLWELLCGERLFRGDNDVTILRKVLNVEVPAPTSKRDDVPVGLEEIILRALSGEPADRFPDMRQMELALSRFLFSGAVDPATAEVRGAYARITQGGEQNQPRRTGLLPAIAIASESVSSPAAPAAAPSGPPPPTVIRRDEQGTASITDDDQQQPRPTSMLSSVFVSSAKLPAAPRGPAVSELAPPTLLVDNAVSLDAAAAAFDQQAARRQASAPAMSSASAVNDTIELAPVVVPSLPTAPERSRSQRPSPGPITMVGDADLVAAARDAAGDVARDPDTTIAEDEDGTPATRTLVPAGGQQSVAPRAPVALKPAVDDDDDDDIRLPRSRAPLFAAASVLGLGLLVGIGFAFSGDEAPATTTAAVTPPVEAPVQIAKPVEVAKPAESAKPVEVAAAVEPAQPPVPVSPPPAPEPAPAATTPPAPATSKPAASAPMARTAAKPATTKADAEPSGAPGSVYVDVPGGWATVAIGKKVYGDTPLTLALPSGRYTVTLTSGDGVTKKNVPLTVIAGKKVLIRETFK